MAEDGFYFDFGHQPAETHSTGGDCPQSNPHDCAQQGHLTKRKYLIASPHDTHLQDWAGNYPVHSTHLSGATLPLKLELDGGRCVCYQSAPSIESLERDDNGDNGVLNTKEKRDIIPGKYYGGLKVWSCAPYLSLFLAQPLSMEGTCNNSGDSLLTDHFKRWCDRENCDGSEKTYKVMELGCGQSLPALSALMLLSTHLPSPKDTRIELVLQDYNEEVLESCALPNLAATLLHSGFGSDGFTLQCLSGDWDAVAPTPDDENYDSCDFILGSDVTFDSQACSKLASVLCRCLRSEIGVAVIASKEYYFGTNGGAFELETQLNRLNGRSEWRLSVATLDRLEDSKGMNRVILKITKQRVNR